MGSSLTAGRLQAGVAERALPQAVGLRLAAELHPRVAQAARTPLMAKALVLANAEASLALVTLDLFGLQADMAAALRDGIAARCSLPAEAVMVVCSRTRGAPYTTPVVGWEGVEEAYAAQVVAQVPEVVAEAQGALAPSSLGVGLAILPHLVYNHRFLTRNYKAISAPWGVPRDEILYPEGPTDPALTVLVIRDERGRPLALLWNFAADNRFPQDDQVSADLPYYVQQGLDERLGRHVPSLYLPGCGGNISFTYGLEETADALASGVMAVQLETPCDPTIELGWARQKMVLPIRDYTQFWSRADIELKAPHALEAFEKELEYMRADGARAVPAEVLAFRLGRVGLAGLAGLPFVELAQQIKSESPFASTLVVGAVGPDVGTVITRAAFEAGGFEAWPARSARVGPGGGEFMAEQAADLLAALHRR